MTDANLPRRRFAAQVALGTMAGVAAATASPQPPVAAAADRPEPVKKTEGDQAGSQSGVDLVLGLIRSQYPASLDDAQWAELRRHVEFHQARARLLRSMPLENYDELPIVFRVLGR